MLADAEAIRDWIGERSPERAERWFDGLFATIETLETFPLRCPKVTGREGIDPDARLLLYGTRQFAFRNLFTVQDDLVRIIAIVQNARGSAEP